MPGLLPGKPSWLTAAHFCNQDTAVIIVSAKEGARKDAKIAKEGFAFFGFLREMAQTAIKTQDTVQQDMQQSPMTKAGS